MNNQYENITALLGNLEKELRALSLWHSDAPSEQDLASAQPFCMDTLEFNQWLQFIFIKRISHLVASGGRLPDSCDIAPYAEEYFRAKNIPANSLIENLRQIDDAIKNA